MGKNDVLQKVALAILVEGHNLPAYCARDLFKSLRCGKSCAFNLKQLVILDLSLLVGDIIFGVCLGVFQMMLLGPGPQVLGAIFCFFEKN